MSQKSIQNIQHQTYPRKIVVFIYFSLYTFKSCFYCQCEIKLLNGILNSKLFRIKKFKLMFKMMFVSCKAKIKCNFFGYNIRYLFNIVYKTRRYSLI